MSLKKQAKKVQKAGFNNSGQDSMLAHINPQEANLLKMFGGSGRTDPKTGLKHFDYGGGGMGDGGWGGGDGGGGGGGGFGGGDGGGDYGGWGDGGLGGLGDGSPSGGPGGDIGGGFGDPGDGFGGYGGWGDSGDLGNGLGDMYSNEGYSYGNPDYTSNSPVNSSTPNDNDIFSRIAKFTKHFAMNKAISSIAQSNPVLGMAANLFGPVAANQLSDNPNQDTPVGQQIAGRMVDTIAAPVQGPVQGLVGLANLFGANINLPTMGQGLAHANLDYKGMPEGQSGFGNSTTGQTGTGGTFDNILNGAATAGGLYGMFKNYQNANGQANNLSSMFGPNSPYAKQLQQSLERRDAASGRRSQYGPRSVELQAKLAGMANQISPNILASRQAGNQSLMQMLGMLT